MISIRFHFLLFIMGTSTWAHHQLCSTCSSNSLFLYSLAYSKGVLEHLFVRVESKKRKVSSVGIVTMLIRLTRSSKCRLAFRFTHQNSVCTCKYMSSKCKLVPLNFRHRASCILGQAFRYSPENAFYVFNQQMYFII